MCMGVLPASTFAPHACHAHRVQKRALAPLELKSQIAVSYHMGTGNQTQVMWKNSHCS